MYSEIRNDYVLIRQRKITRMMMIVGVVMFIVLVRLAYLQIVQQDELSQQGKKNYLATETIPAVRGNVFDAHGFVLASSRPVYDIYWRGSGKKFLSDEQMQTIRALEQLLAVTLTDEVLGSIKNAERHRKGVCLIRDISLDQVSRFYEHFPAASHLYIHQRFMRIYPHKTLASHLVGYLNRLKEEGTSGLERYFESLLQGSRGSIVHIKDSMGAFVAPCEYNQAHAGENIRLTIDIQLQHMAETLFGHGQVGAFILMDPYDGAIKALVSAPGFDPNKFLYPISVTEWHNSICSSDALLNRATSAVYPPASLFKLVTLTAGCEEGIVSHDTTIDCKGYVLFCGRKYYCMRRWGHGRLSIKQALARSCNVHCYEIAQQLSIDTLADYARRFGLGEKTGFLLQELAGTVPTTTWKRLMKRQPWWQGETISASIGQSYLQVTPLQVARMISSICTGYLVRPRLLMNEDIVRHPLLISDETLTFLRESMAEAVKYGTGQVLNDLKNFDIHAKTGTAQTCSLSVKKSSREHYEHAWFSGWFSYKKSPPLTMIILLEHVGSSRYARDIAQSFLERYAVWYDQQHDRCDSVSCE